MNQLQFIADYLKGELVNELVRQGHKATGDLAESVRVTIEEEASKWRIVGRSFFYGVYLDRGRPAGTKKVPISALIKWIIQKRLQSDKKKIRSLAFAIQYKIWKNGIKDPRRLGWVTNTLEANKQRIKEDMQLAIRQNIEAKILNIIRLTNEKI